MNSNEFPAFMNKLAKSNELIMEKIIKSKNGTLGDKIKLLERRLSGIDTGFDTDLLVRTLRSFNRYWNITKHGNEVAGFPFSYFKEGRMTVFDEALRDRIKMEFEGCQKRLKSLERM